MKTMRSLFLMLMVLSLVCGFIGCKTDSDDDLKGEVKFPSEWTAKIKQGVSAEAYVREDGVYNGGFYTIAVENTNKAFTFRVDPNTSLRMEPVSINGKVIKAKLTVVANMPDFSLGNEIILCTNWTLSNDVLTFEGSDILDLNKPHTWTLYK